MSGLQDALSRLAAIEETAEALFSALSYAGDPDAGNGLTCEEADRLAGDACVVQEAISKALDALWRMSRERRPDSAMLQRFQRSRRKGARLPPGTICVTRKTAWGNEHDWQVLGRTEAVRRFRADAEKREREDPEGFVAWLAPLRGKNLACYCPLGEPCHADVLLELANREAAA